MTFDLRGKKIWVAGHNGMVGRALMRQLQSEHCTLLTVSRQELDLCNQQQVHTWMQAHKPDAIFIAAATVGGIGANMEFPAEFIYNNLAIATNVIEAAYRAEVTKLLYLGSSCIYPRDTSQPMAEDALLTGPLEPTNQYYAIAKIAGIKMCEAYRAQYGCNFISAMPPNLYGPDDHFNPDYAHVIPALIYKLHQAKINGEPRVSVWGTGKAKREFLYVDDLAQALVLLMRNYSEAQHINVGCGHDITIKALVSLLADIIGYKGELYFDTSRPDGTPRKLFDISRISALGWTPSTDLRDGLINTYDWYVKQL